MHIGKNSKIQRILFLNNRMSDLAEIWELNQFAFLSKYLSLYLKIVNTYVQNNVYILNQIV